jgi:hypothetical protein
MGSGLESGLKLDAKMQSRANAARQASGRKNGRCQPTEEAPGQTAAVVEDDAGSDGLAISEHFKTYSTGVNEARYAFASTIIARSQRVARMRAR